ncbi:MAG: hypothetical protein E7013_02380 [Alphaproteobacteria bacterium]|nr:hypothetical protein [Alphaproteobacteria bacterium]
MALSDDEKARIEALSLEEIREKLREVNNLVADCSLTVKACEIRNPSLASYYHQVASFLSLKKKIDAISDDRKKLIEKDKCQYNLKEAQYVALFSDVALKDEIKDYSKILVDKFDATELQRFVAHRLKYLEQKRKKRITLMKKLALIGTVALAVGGVIYSLGKTEEKAPKKSAETTQTVQTTQTSQQSVPFGLSEEKLKAFTERISKYPQKTQQAMCDGIEYLQWLHNAQKTTFHNQYYDKDLAEANMVRLEGQIVDNDKTVWAELSKINQAYIEQAKVNPVLEFDLSVALSALPDRYDIAKNQQKKAQQAAKGR